MAKGNNNKVRTGAKTSKRGVIIGAIVLAVVIIGAAIAYNALAPNANTDTNLQPTQGTSNTSTGDSSATATSTGDSSASSTSSKSNSTEAPDFTMQDADGNVVTLRQFRGKPVVLNFWASTCGPCKGEMPGFQSAFEQRGDDVQFVMVDVVGFNGETADRGREFMASNGYTLPVYFDEEGAASVPYGLSSIPRTFFIDTEGYLIANAAGAIDEETLQRGLDMIS